MTSDQTSRLTQLANDTLPYGIGEKRIYLSSEWTVLRKGTALALQNMHDLEAREIKTWHADVSVSRIPVSYSSASGERLTAQLTEYSCARAERNIPCRRGLCLCV
jgi:hypothetical protein